MQADLNDDLAAQQFLFSVATDAAVRASQRYNTDVANRDPAICAPGTLPRAAGGARRGPAANDADRKLQS